MHNYKENSTNQATSSCWPVRRTQVQPNFIHICSYFYFYIGQ